MFSPFSSQKKEFCCLLRHCFSSLPESLCDATKEARFCTRLWAGVVITLTSLSKMTPVETQMCLEQFLVYFSSFFYSFFLYKDCELSRSRIFHTQSHGFTGTNSGKSVYVCSFGWLWTEIALSSRENLSCNRFMTSAGTNRMGHGLISPC